MVYSVVSKKRNYTEIHGERIEIHRVCKISLVSSSVNLYVSSVPSVFLIVAVG